MSGAARILKCDPKAISHRRNRIMRKLGLKMSEFHRLVGTIKVDEKKLKVEEFHKANDRSVKAGDVVAHDGRHYVVRDVLDKDGNVCACRHFRGSILKRKSVYIPFDEYQQTGESVKVEALH